MYIHTGWTWSCYSNSFKHIIYCTHTKRSFIYSIFEGEHEYHYMRYYIFTLDNIIIYEYISINKMRALIQRVSSASVIVEGSVVGQINQGILALIGISRDDTIEDTKWLVNKILNLRIFEDSNNYKPWTNSIKSLNLELLLVSQFTLHASCKKPKPDFHRSMGPIEAKEQFQNFVDTCKKEHQPDKIQTGVFGAMMSVNLVNEGPVTLWLDSKNRNDDEWPCIPLNSTITTPVSATTPSTVTSNNNSTNKHNKATPAVINDTTESITTSNI